MKTVPASKTPLVLQLIQWILNPVGYLNTNFKRFGDLFNAKVLWGETDGLFIVSDPKALQYILTHDVGRGRELSAPGDANQILKSLLGQHNLLMLNGEQHRARRQLMMPPFHGERLSVYGRLIQDITLQVIAQWPTHQPIDIRASMQKITMRVILQAVFGLHQGERYRQLEQLLSRRLNLTGSPITSAIVFLPWLQKDLGDWSPGGQFRFLTEQTDQLLFAEIRERRAQPDPERVDILSLLLAAKDEQGIGLTDQELRDELMTLLLVGHETTATALTWAMYWIHLLPEVKQKLMAELETVSDPNDPLQFLQLPYLSAVCNETLRIYPVAMLTFPRRVEVPIELCGYQLKPGMLLMGAIYLIHQREELYPQPQQFCPERFLERQFSPYEFSPFGGGARRCVGAALALYELKIAVATMMKQFDLNLLNKRPVQPGRRGVTLGQTSPVMVEKLEVRTSAKALENV